MDKITLSEKAVSTHSRPKAAACSTFKKCGEDTGFNTQPPEGGCVMLQVQGILLYKFQHTAARRRLPLAVGSDALHLSCFNTQPPEGGCALRESLARQGINVSTHSRPKAAASLGLVLDKLVNGFNTQPPEGGCLEKGFIFTRELGVSTHSRPKAAAGDIDKELLKGLVSTHSRPKAAASMRALNISPITEFQHTAARRRLH